MVGAKISVAVTDGENIATSKETAAVAEVLGVVDAEQIGMAKVSVEFNTPITANDKISVKKGATEQEISAQAFDDDTFLSKTLTMKNNLSSGTYTVTLTPADGSDATSVEFDAVSATKATRIGVTNNYLVMKNTDFNEGYCYITGYNDFDEQILLSGLTINAAPSDSTSYDSATGRVTIKYADPGFAVVKNVSVYGQYTGADGNILTCQETLEVTTVGYPSAITFGEVKKDGTPRKDGKITIAELGSNKYYVELNSIQDQYGNDLSADDLNTLVSKKLLTVIPTDTSPVFFGTNTAPFATVGSKVVVFLTPGNGRPGTGSLMITGAGGSFAKEVTIEDNPYIQVLSVDIPDLYEDQQSDEFTLSAVDQYGEDIDLYDFAPDTAVETLDFTDLNHLTGLNTSIKAEAAGLWKVKKDTVKKDFTVKYTPAGDAKSMVTFTIISAGMVTTVKSVTIGEPGLSAQIVAPTSSTQITAAGTSNIASFIQFKDANGKVMDRIDDWANYPTFLYNPGLQTDDSIDADDYVGFVWTVSEAKLATNSYNKGDDAKAALSNDAAGKFYDSDGVIAGGLNANVAGALGASDADGMTTPSYYVTLLALDNNGHGKVLDSKAFRFVYVPTSFANLKFSVKDTSKMLLYANENSKDSETIKIVVTNDIGESWEVAAGGTTPSAPFTSNGAVVSGVVPKDSVTGSGKVAVKVYEPYTGKAVDTVEIPYDTAKPVATSTAIGFATTDANNDGSAPEGANWNPAGRVEFTTGQAGAVETMENGEFKITNATVWGDTFTASIKDQYGVVMTNSTVKLNGQAITGFEDPDVGDELNFVITNGSQKIDLDVTVGLGDLTTNASAVDQSESVEDETGLATALATAAADDVNDYTITLTKSTELEDMDELVIPENVTLKVNKGIKLNTAAKDVTINGELVVEGVWTATGTNENHVTVSGTGTISGTGHATLTYADLDGALTSTLAGTTLELVNCTILAGAEISFGGNVEIGGALTVNGDAVLLDGVTFNMEGADLEIGDSGSIVIDPDDTTATVTIIDQTGETITDTTDIEEGTAFALNAVAAIEALPTTSEDTIAAYTSTSDLLKELTALETLADALTPAEGYEISNNEKEVILAAAIAADLVTANATYNEIDNAVTALKEADEDKWDNMADALVTTLGGKIATYLENESEETLAGVETAYKNAKAVIDAYDDAFEDDYKAAEAYAAAVEIIALAGVTANLNTTAGTVTLTGTDGFEVTSSTSDQDKATVAYEDGVATVTAGADGSSTITLTIAGDAYARVLKYTATVTGSDDTLALALAAAEDDADKIVEIE